MVDVAECTISKHIIIYIYFIHVAHENKLPVPVFNSTLSLRFISALFYVRFYFCGHIHVCILLPWVQVFKYGTFCFLGEGREE